MSRTDTTHLGLMLAALALTYLLPFELLLLSYAILGPLHYLTEISWLHDRGYFSPVKSAAWIFVPVAVAAFFLMSVPALGVVLWMAFLAGVIGGARIGATRRIALAVLATAVTGALLTQNSFFYIAAVLLPTLFHVAVFTLIFMIVGAHRAGSAAQALLVVAYLAMIGLILVVPSGMSPVVRHSLELDHQYFGSIASALGRLLRLPDVQFDGRITGLLSFVYTYHYLNWFIKADVIGWRRIPKWRCAAIATLAPVATGLYFYDYGLGMTVLLALSMAHVVLEFPLNALSLRQLAGIATRGISRPLDYSRSAPH